MSFTPFAGYQQQVASTPVAGIALINGTQVLAQFTAPNDGQLHYMTAVLSLQVTSAETGGQISVNFVDPQGNARSFTAIASGAGVGLNSLVVPRLIQPNSVVSVSQSVALSGGAAVMNCQIWLA